MAKFGKRIGAGLGWAFGGPIGAVNGLGLGYILIPPQQADKTRETAIPPRVILLSACWY
jgi:hypothetical protein